MVKRRYQWCIILAVGLLVFLYQGAWAQTPSSLPFDVNARSAVLMNAHSGVLLYEKAPDERLIPDRKSVV